MGVHTFDQFTLLHAACGIIAYFFGVSLPVWIAVHTLFEWAENTDWGRHLIQSYVTFWPGGKPSADSWRNMTGDTVGAAAGWALAYQVDQYGRDHRWYPAYTRGKKSFP